MRGLGHRGIGWRALVPATTAHAPVAVPILPWRRASDESLLRKPGKGFVVAAAFPHRRPKGTRPTVMGEGHGLRQGAPLAAVFTRLPS